VLATVLALFAAATARLFVWPPQGMPAHVSAIVMLNGPGDRYGTALRLARTHRASVIVISRGSSYWGHGSICAPEIREVKVICFDPRPPTTRGETEYAGELATRYHWRSIVLVATTPQNIRARLRLGRCFGGKVYVVDAPLPARAWPYAIAHEWGAITKAMVVQRSC
jgi:hypothetical protein